MLSFVVPTYNRIKLIEETLNSILATDFGLVYEVIIVDDYSTDNTKEFIRDKYSKQLNSNIFKYHYLEKNVGVTGAKNYGARIAKGKWIVFLDSDDLFISKSKVQFIQALHDNEDSGVVFFRCNTFDGNLLGERYNENKYFDLNKYLTLGFPGECLPVIKKEIIERFPYEKKLRGFESIAYFRMLKSNVKVCISTVVSRKYRTANEDRLSSFKGRLKRSKQMLDGYKILMDEYKDINYNVPFGLRLRLVKYFLMMILSKVIR